MAILLASVGAGCSVNPEIVEVRAIPSILCPGDSSQVDTIYRNVEGVTMTFTPGRAVTLPGADGSLTLNGVNEGPICSDTLVESVGTLGDKRDSGSGAIEVIEGEHVVPLDFAAMCSCVDRGTSEFRGYAPREVEDRIYSESLLVLSARNASGYTVTSSHAGVSDTAASGTSFAAFSGAGVRLVGEWLANPVLLPAPGTRYDCCADPEGPVEPTPLPGGTRRVPYPPITVEVLAGCAPPPPAVCTP